MFSFQWTQWGTVTRPGYISLFRCQRHPYWITRAGGRDVLGLEGRKDVVGRKAGGGEVNMTPWFIVLSCHRAARIRSFSLFFFFCSFSFLQGRGGRVWGRLCGCFFFFFFFFFFSSFFFFGGGGGGGGGATIADAIMAASSAKSLQGLIQIN